MGLVRLPESTEGPKLLVVGSGPLSDAVLSRLLTRECPVPVCVLNTDEVSILLIRKQMEEIHSHILSEADKRARQVQT